MSSGLGCLIEIQSLVQELEAKKQILQVTSSVLSFRARNLGRKIVRPQSNGDPHLLSASKISSLG